ncbi:MAG TPA: MYG1 family protein, partial [Candidatus Paceibacterota bacterium]|nr:MYG1 family protein [Candidatus Paceibacterota bacterium]
MSSKNFVIVTHDNLFHLDDLFACAIIQIYLDKKEEKYSIIRTRDKEVISNADYVVDVGDIYDASLNRFDHHQKGGAGARENNIPYASCGLVWKRYGELIAGSRIIADILDAKVFQVLDADDNGLEFYKNT